mmetsp:Transcript_17769/g.50848  ORF Transcript_17769/g.50848 Transcript_17769/m.50848 type:complete len:269 (+) Transcript_17769:1415-2221(+)
MRNVSEPVKLEDGHMRDELAKHIFLHVLQFLGIFSSDPCLEGGLLCPFLAQPFGLMLLLLQFLFCQGLELANVEDIDRLHPWAKKYPDGDPRRPTEDEGPGNEGKSYRQNDGSERNDGREVTLLPDDDILDKAKAVASDSKVLLNGVEDRLQWINGNSTARLCRDVHICIADLLHLFLPFLLFLDGLQTPALRHLLCFLHTLRPLISELLGLLGVGKGGDIIGAGQALAENKLLHDLSKGSAAIPRVGNIPLVAHDSKKDPGNGSAAK